MLSSRFGNESHEHMQSLERFMNLALRTVTGQHAIDHTWRVGVELDWSTARQLYELHSLNLVHEIHCNLTRDRLGGGVGSDAPFGFS